VRNDAVRVELGRRHGQGQNVPPVRVVQQGLEGQRGAVLTPRRLGAHQHLIQVRALLCHQRVVAELRRHGRAAAVPPRALVAEPAPAAAQGEAGGAPAAEHAGALPTRHPRRSGLLAQPPRAQCGRHTQQGQPPQPRRRHG